MPHVHMHVSSVCMCDFDLVQNVNVGKPSSTETFSPFIASDMYLSI